MNVHYLKIKPVYFMAVADGRKRFELRKNNRNFRAGDLVVLQEYANGSYTENSATVKISYVLSHVPAYGLQAGYVIFGFRVLLLCIDGKES